MITCTLRGQLGNQAFIIATAIAHALKTRTTYALPERSGKRDQFPNYFPGLPRMQQWQGEVFDCTPYTEPMFGIYQPLPENPNLHLRGYFQSEKYFKSYRQGILSSFNFPKFEMQHDVVAIHIRRGDYLKLAGKHNVATVDWIEKAMDQFDFGYKFRFFSDDIEWCIRNFNQNSRCTFSLETNPLVELGAIAACEHGIMSASTFGWWGNWIADNNGKGRRVIVPKDWFNPNYTRLKTNDIVPVNWERL